MQSVAVVPGRCCGLERVMQSLRLAVFLVLATSACVAPPAQPPAPRPMPTVTPPVPTPPPVATNWEDRPPAAGTWTYARSGNGSRAAFGVEGGAPLFILQCDAAARSVVAARSALASGTLTLRATTGARSYDAAFDPTSQMLTARIAASDPQLDALAFSRGRILVGASGSPDLILPIWPEFARVVEDCR